jgi:hypothetical protein
MSDYTDDFAMWTDMWDQAQRGDYFPPEPKPQAPEISEEEEDYGQIYAHMLGMGGGEEELLQENRKNPNPVHPDSTGPDNQGPKPAWVDENLLKEVESIKQKMFDLENKMAELGVTKKGVQKPVKMEFGKQLSSQMESLRKRLDKISSSLGIKDEPSPWVVED